MEGKKEFFGTIAAFVILAILSSWALNIEFGKIGLIILLPWTMFIFWEIQAVYFHWEDMHSKEYSFVGFILNTPHFPITD